MAVSSQVFIEKFSFIPGSTTQKRYQNFFLLLRALKNRTGSNNEAEEIISAIKPRNHLEEVFKVHILLHFRRVIELLDILKSENPIFIKMILKQEWFIDEAFKHVDGSQLVEDIFPYVSFSTRAKIITNLAKRLKNEEKVQDYFTAVSNKYGFHSASKLLTACNVDFIRFHTLKHRIRLKPAHLLAVAKKYPDFVSDYLDELESNRFHQHAKIYNYHCIYEYLARSNPVKFLTLIRRKNVSITFGYQTTKKIIHSDKSRLLKEPSRFEHLLNPKALVHELKNDFKPFYLGLFPKEIRFLHLYRDNCTLHLLQFLPSKIRQNVLLGSFFTAYNFNIWDNKDSITTSLLDILDSEKRDICVAAKLSDEFIENYVCYYPTEKSIPILKERLNVASDIHCRSSLIEYIVNTCAVNNDYVALEDFCKYFVNRHKNDSEMVRESFLNKLYLSFDLTKLSGQCWLYIAELLDRAELNNEITDSVSNCSRSYFKYRLIKGLPVENYIKIMLNEMVKNKEYNTVYRFSKELAEFGRTFLVMVEELISSLFKDESLRKARLLFLLIIIKFNKNHGEISLLTYPELISNFTEAISNKILNPHETKIVFKYFIYSSTDFYKTVILHAYFQHLTDYFDESITLFLMRDELNTIIANIETILSAMPKSPRNRKYDKYKTFYSCFFKKIRNYANQPLFEKTVQYYTNEIKSQECTNKEMAVIALSYLLNGQDFLNLIEPLFPATCEIDVGTVTSDENYTYKVMINCLKNVVPPSLTIKSILFFARGNYWQATLSSLYSLSHRIPEVKMGPLVNELCERAVSVKKHGLKLICDIYPKLNVVEMLTKFMKNAKNVSLHLFIFRNAFRSFLRNPEECTFGLLRMNLPNLVSHDTELSSVVNNISRIPDEYVAIFVEVVWDVLNSITEKGTNTSEERNRLLNYFDKNNFTLLNVTFIIKLIDEYYLKQNEQYNDFNIKEFTNSYLYYYTNTNVELRIDFIVKKLKSLANTSKSTAIRILCDMAKNCCLNSRSGFLEHFLFFWDDIFKSYEEFFDQYLIFQMCFRAIQTPNENFLVNIGDKIGQYCNTVIMTHGMAIINIVARALEFFVYDYMPSEFKDGNNKYVYVVIKSMLENNLSIHSAMLCIHILPKCLPDENDIKQLNHIVDVMKDLNDTGINILLKFNKCLH